MSVGPHRSFLAAGLLGVAILLAACPSQVEEETPTPDATPTVEPSVAATASAAPSVEPEAEATSAFELEAGDCFSVESDELTSVTVVECVVSHEYEVFAVFDHQAGPNAAFPGQDELLVEADTLCQPSFEAYVGHDYQTSTWFITSLTPSEQTWVDGDRQITCLLNQQDEDEEPIMVTGSAEGAAE